MSYELKAKDFCKGMFNSEDGQRHCLTGWANTLFPNDISTIYTELRRQILKSRKKNTKNINRVNNVGIAAFNDAKHRKKSQLAKVWNNAMKALGYI